MRLAEYTDYTLRVLMHCATHRDERITIAALAETFGVSKNHLMKIVNDLGRQGLLLTTRGRTGGISLGREPASIRIGDVVRAAETDFRLVECFDPAHNACTLTHGCRLRHTLGTALQAFLAELDKATLADLVRPGRAAAPGPAVVRLPTPTTARAAARAPASGRAR